MTKHAETYRRNLGAHLNRGAPKGHASRAFRVQGPAELLDAFQRLSPAARGRILEDAMTAAIVRDDDA